MIISDTTLRRLMDSGELQIDPLGDQAMQPASVDCSIGSEFLVLDYSGTEFIQCHEDIRYRPITTDHIMVQPHTFILATTREYIKLPKNVTAFVEGRSSIGRLGLFVQNAGWVDAGFEGCITLELYNASPVAIQLNAGQRVCQLVFCFMDQPATNSYSGKYQGQRSVTGSRICRDPDLPHPEAK